MILTWHLNPVAFHVPFIGYPIRWYGIMYVVAFIIFLFWSWQNFKYIKDYKDPRTKTTHRRFYKDYSEWETIAFIGFLFGILGGRISHFAFFNPQPLIDDWTEIFRIWNGGMAIQGGFTAAIIYSIYTHWKNKRHLWVTADCITAPLAFAFGIGRIGNITNGELAGKPTNGDWGMIFPHIDEVVRHVPPVYELVGYMLIVALTTYLFIYWKSRPTGILFPISIIGAAVWRFFVEYYKVSPLNVGPFTSGQVLCLVLTLSGIIITIWLLKDPIRIELDRKN
ncbi:MAG TPA: prolipoprotein diacylglyceryl transferase [Candidatus Gracilibacteria bacterium]